MKKKRKTPELLELIASMSMVDIMLLRESCASCSIEGNSSAEAAGRALDAILHGEPASEADAKALHGLLLYFKSRE